MTMPAQERIQTIIKADKEYRRKQRYWYIQIHIAMTLHEAKKKEVRE